MQRYARGRAAGLAFAVAALALTACRSPLFADPIGFERAGAGLPTEGQWREGFDLADLDGDGHLDLVHGPPRSGGAAPLVLLGQGDGSFRRWRAALPTLPYDYGIARVGDLDGDGLPDLVFGMHRRGLVALLRRGDSFVRSGDGLDFSRETSAFASRAVRILDWDGDGCADVLALGEGPRPPARGGPRVRPPAGSAQGVVLYRGEGNGRFRRVDRGTGPRELFGRSLATGDFDADGRPDFVTATSHMGRRDLVHWGREDGLWEPGPVPSLPDRGYVRAVATADFDGDGRSDFAAAWSDFADGAWRHGTAVYRARPGRTWVRESVSVGDGPRGAQALAAGDFDADGRLDLAALGDRGELAVFLARGDGRLRRLRSPPPPPFGACRGAALESGDLDGDGRADLVAAYARDDASCPGGGGIAAWRSVARGRVR